MTTDELAVLKAAFQTIIREMVDNDPVDDQHRNALQSAHDGLMTVIQIEQGERHPFADPDCDNAPSCDGCGEAFQCVDESLTDYYRGILAQDGWETMVLTVQSDHPVKAGALLTAIRQLEEASSADDRKPMTLTVKNDHPAISQMVEAKPFRFVPFHQLER